MPTSMIAYLSCLCFLQEPLKETLDLSFGISSEIIQNYPTGISKVSFILFEILIEL